VGGAGLRRGCAALDWRCCMAAGGARCQHASARTQHVLSTRSLGPCCNQDALHCGAPAPDQHSTWPAQHLTSTAPDQHSTELPHSLT
jgi:hypothetical protein